MPSFLWDALMIVAALEFLFLVFNIVAWRRCIVWSREMRLCNSDLAKALNLASQGKYKEAEEVAKLWRNRMEMARMDFPIWRVVDGKAKRWQWWQRYLGV